MNTTSFGGLNYAILGIYMLSLISIGLWLARKQKSSEDFYLAGRRMPWLPVAMSMYASATSASTFIGLPGIAFDSGVAILGACLVSLLLVPVLAGVLYPTYRRMNCTTSYEYIGSRFGQNARFATSALFVLARLGWLGIVVYAPAKALSIATGMELSYAILVIGSLATAYTALGGLAAVIWTDVLQFCILVAGAGWVFVSLAGTVPNGFSEIISISRSADHFNAITWGVTLTQISTVSVMLHFSLQMLQEYGTDQLSVQRILAVSSTRGAVKATIFNAFTDLVMISTLLLIGLGLFVFYQQNPQALNGVDGDSVLAHYIVTQLPNGVSGLIISAIFAAAMSSMDSGINSIATVVENDFLKYFRKDRPATKPIHQARVMTVVLGGVSIALAFYVAANGGGIVQQFAKFMSLFTAPVLALFVLGFTCRRANVIGWYIGTALAIPVTMCLQKYSDVHWTWYYPASFGLCFVAALLYSALRPNRRPIDPVQAG